MTFKVLSLGCKVNSYECSALSSLLLSKGCEEDKNNQPDIIIVNTCSVTATADQKSRQHIRKMMNNYPDAIVVVMGCYSQGNFEFVADDIKAHIIVGTSNRDKIPDLIEQYRKDKKQIVMVDTNPRKFKYEELAVTSFCENTRAYLKIQDGCDNFCTYCLIPYRRGKMRSRNKEYVLKEAEYLVSQNYQEIVLTGIHVGGYGRDLDNTSFSDLVKSLTEIKGLYSLRISSIEESEIDNDLIASTEKLFEIVPAKVDELKVGEALQEIFDVLKKANKYIDDTTPWILAKDETKQDRLKTVLYNLLETIRICSVYLQAFIPETAEKIFRQLNTEDKDFESAKKFGLLKDGTVLNEPEHLFDRIEVQD